MKQAVYEILQSFRGVFASEEFSALQAEQAQEAVVGAKEAQPAYTVFVRGRQEGSEEPLAIVLLTTPSVAADDAAILEFAARRARSRKAPYFLIWTVRDATLWRTPKPGIPAARDSLEKLRDYPDLYEISGAGQLVLDEQTRIRIVARGHEILSDLKKLLLDEALELVQIDATYFVGRLLDAVHQLLPLVSDSLHHRLQVETSLREELEKWAVKQSIAGSPADPEFATSVARQIIYRLLGKVLFYQSLRRYARKLPKLDLRGVDSAQVIPTLQTAFAQALKIDYQAVFEQDVPDRIKWPAEASLGLSSLINDLNTRDFSHLPQDVIGTVFERLIPPEERHGLGQYFTSENLCDLITAFCVDSPNNTVLDPTCGTGTFLIRAYDRLRSLGQKDHAKLLSKVWGIDISPFPAELATINLFRQHIAEHGNFPRIVCADFLKVSPGDHFPFPPPKMDLEHPEVIEETIPAFDAIIGNFPYISAAQIEKYEAGYLDFLRERLITDWFDEFPQLFYYKDRKNQAAFERLVAAGHHRGHTREGVQHKLSTYADLYVYLFLHSARFLKPGGRMGIVTSNAWLDVNYGHELQEFFLRHFKIVAVLESRCEPWFVEASVNTVVTIVERCSEEDRRESNLVHFAKVKRPLAELIPGDPVTDSVQRWKTLGNLITKIERSGLKYSKTYPLGLVTEEDDNFRIRILRQGEMREGLLKAGKTVKWGRYLRAPDVFFELAETNKLCLLNEIATPRRGGLTRINEFFHVTPETARQFSIEAEYLLPLFKSPKQTNTITVDPSDLDIQIFVCRRSKAELRKLRHRGALGYIDWGENQKYTQGEFKGLPWPEGTWVKDRKPGWWALPSNEITAGQVFMSEATGDTHIQRYSETPIIPDKRLYYLSPAEGISPTVLAAVLNSAITSLGLEVTGRVTMGDGVLEFSVEDTRDYLLVPDPRRFSRADRSKLANAFKQLVVRPVHSVFEEIKRKDRVLFDSIILGALGLKPDKYVPRMYEGLCELVRERLELAAKRSKARKTRVRGERAERRTAEEVLEELLPSGVRRFPEDFLSPAALKAAKVAIPLPDEPLIFENRPLFMTIHTKDGKFSKTVKTPMEAKFLVYSQLAGHKVAQIPEQTVEISRTVAHYEKYLRELRRQLYEAYYRRTLDTKTAGRLTQSAFDRLKLPNVET